MVKRSDGRFISPQTTLTFQARGAVWTARAIIQLSTPSRIRQEMVPIWPDLFYDGAKASLVIQGISPRRGQIMVSLEVGVNVLNFKSLKVTPTVMLGCMLSSYRNAFR